MKFHKLTDLLKSYSTWGIGAMAGLPVLNDYVEWIQDLIPAQYQPMALLVLGVFTIFLRAIKQDKITGKPTTTTAKKKSK